MQGLVASSDDVGILDGLERLQPLLLTALGGCHAVAFQELLTLGLGRLLLRGRVLAQLGKGLGDTDVLGRLLGVARGRSTRVLGFGF